MLTGMRFRLDLTPEQTVMATQAAGVCRTVWNTALDLYRYYARDNIGKVQQDRTYIGVAQLCREMAQARLEIDWLAAAPSKAMQQTLKDLDKTIRQHGPWKTKFRSKSRWSPSFRFPEGDRVQITMLNSKWAQMNLPKLGQVRFRHSRMIGGLIRSVTMSKDAGHWYAAVLVEDGVITPTEHAGPTVGVDRGIKIVAALSDGQVLHPDRPFVTAGEDKRIRRLQRHLARQKKGSKRRGLTKTRIAATSAKGRRRRQDWAAQTGHQLATQFSTVTFEDLKIPNMVKRATPKPDPDRPGHYLKNGAAAKSGLNRVIHNAGWGALKLATANAGRRTGTRVQVVPAANSSRECSECHYTDKDNRKSQAVFSCLRCKFTTGADYNAACITDQRGSRKILAMEPAAGLAVAGRGGLQATESLNRQLQPAAA